MTQPSQSQDTAPQPERETPPDAPDAPAAERSGAPKRRRGWPFWLAVVAVVLVVTLALIRAALATPPGRWVVAGLLDGREVAGQTLSVSGLEGDLLRDPRIARLTVADANGVWLDARDVRMRWSPTALASRQAHVQRLSAAEVVVLRQPVIADRAPSAGEEEGASAWRVALNDLAVERLTLADGLAPGPLAGDFAVRGALGVNRDLAHAALAVERLDGVGESATVRAGRTGDGAYLVSAQLTAPAGSPLTQVQGVEAADYAVSVSFAGRGGTGRGQAAMVRDAMPAASGDAWWRGGLAQARAQADVAQLPVPSVVVERLQGPIALTLDLQPSPDPAMEAQPRRRLRAVASAPVGEVTARADLAGLAPDGAIAVTAALDDPMAALGDGFPIQIETVEADGVLILAPGRRFVGTAAATGLSRGDLRVARAAGPINAALGEGGAVSARAALQATGLSLPEAARRVVGDAPTLAVEADRVAVAAPWRVIARLDEAPVLGVADGEVNGGAFAFAVEAETGDLARLGVPIAGPVTLSGQVARAADQDGVSVAATAALNRNDAGLDALGALLGREVTLGLAADVTGEAVVVRDITLAGARAVARAQGDIALAPLTAALDVEAEIDPGVGLAGVSVPGGVQANASARGPLDALVLTARARAPQLDLAGRRVETLDLAVRVEDALDAARARVALTGQAEGEPIAADFAAQLGRGGGLDVTDLSVQALGVAANGDVRLTPDALLDGALVWRAPAFGGTGRLGLAASGGEQTFDAEATLEPVGQAAQRLRSARLTLAGTLRDAQGRVSAQGAGGAPFDVEAPVDVRLQDGAVRVVLSPQGEAFGAPLTTRTPLTLEAGADGMTAVGAVGLGRGALAIDAARSAQEARVRLELNDAPVRPFAETFAGRSWRGRMSGAVSLSGQDALTGQADLTAVGLRPPWAPDTAVIDVIAGARADEAGISIQASANNAAGLLAARAQASSDVTLALGAQPLVGLDAATLQAVVDLDADLGELLTLFAPASVSGEGEVTAALRARGPVLAPRLSGGAQIAGASARDSVTGWRVRDVNATAVEDDGRLVIEGAARDLGDGRLDLSAVIDLAAVHEAQVDVSAQSFRLVERDEGQGVVSGDLALRAGADAIDVEGDLTVDEAAVDITRLSAPPGVVTIPVREINVPDDLRAPPQNESPARPLSLDLAVNAPRRLFVRGAGLDSEWSLNADVSGTADDARIVGAAELVRGEYDFAGQRLRLTEGEIRFTGPVSSARLDLTAAYSAPDITAEVNLQGSVTAPTISLSSTPSLPEDEILSQILFGRGTGELTALETAQLAAALASFASGVTGPNLFGSVRDALDLDRLSVGADEDGVTALTSGKYLADNVYLEIETAPTGAAAARVEWTLRPRLEIVSQVARTGEPEVAVRWTRDY